MRGEEPDLSLPLVLLMVVVSWWLYHGGRNDTHLMTKIDSTCVRLSVRGSKCEIKCER